MNLLLLLLLFFFIFIFICALSNSNHRATPPPSFSLVFPSPSLYLSSLSLSLSPSSYVYLPMPIYLSTWVFLPFVYLPTYVHLHLPIPLYLEIFATDPGAGNDHFWLQLNRKNVRILKQFNRSRLGGDHSRRFRHVRDVHRGGLACQPQQDRARRHSSAEHLASQRCARQFVENDFGRQIQCRNSSAIGKIWKFP